MRTTDTIVIGAGQAGLATSRCLTDRGVDHVVLERGRVAERWRNERWDSLRLLTPNWMSRLPGWSYSGSDPHGFMTSAELISYLESYASASAAPIEEASPVERVQLAAEGEGFDVLTPDVHWRAENVVIATGWCDLPVVPAMARHLDPHIAQITPAEYRNPDSLPGGGVLIVGASASGVQLADELNRAGRDVVLAVGRHTRLPRQYRGMDICWWLERTGSFDRTIDELPDPVAARREPSLQLLGRPDHSSLDLWHLRRAGVHLTGRLVGVDGRRVRFAGDLERSVATADVRMRRILTNVDAHIHRTGLTSEVLDPRPIPALDVRWQLHALDLRLRGITSVLWATGHRRSFPWLHVPVLDAMGELRQRRGVTPAPGLYVVGQRFQHRRNSNFIDGVGRDAAAIADHVACRMSSSTRS
jgi:putative flavoprotein involved in K+ transport